MCNRDVHEWVSEWVSEIRAWRPWMREWALCMSEWVGAVHKGCAWMPCMSEWVSEWVSECDSNPNQLTGTFFCVMKQAEFSPLTATAVLPPPFAALMQYSIWYKWPWGLKMVICRSKLPSRPAMIRYWGWESGSEWVREWVGNGNNEEIRLWNWQHYGTRNSKHSSPWTYISALEPNVYRIKVQSTI